MIFLDCSFILSLSLYLYKDIIIIYYYLLFIIIIIIDFSSRNQGVFITPSLFCVFEVFRRYDIFFQQLPYCIFCTLWFFVCTRFFQAVLCCSWCIVFGVFGAYLTVFARLYRDCKSILCPAA